MFQPQSAFNSFWICVDVCPPCVFVYINESVLFVPCSCHKGMFDVFRKRWSFPLTYQVVGTMRSKPLNTIDFIIRVCVCFRTQFAKATELASLRVWVRNERNHSGMRALHIWASHSALFVGNVTFCFRNHLSLRLPLAKQTNFLELFCPCERLKTFTPFTLSLHLRTLASLPMPAVRHALPVQNPEIQVKSTDTNRDSLLSRPRTHWEIRFCWDPWTHWEVPLGVRKKPEIHLVYSNSPSPVVFLKPSDIVYDEKFTRMSCCF